MKNANSRLAAALALAALLTFSGELYAQQHCGKERWSVKTGIDADAGSVNLASPQNATIAQLIMDLTSIQPILHQRENYLVRRQQRSPGEVAWPRDLFHRVIVVPSRF